MSIFVKIDNVLQYMKGGFSIRKNMLGIFILTAALFIGALRGEAEMTPDHDAAKAQISLSPQEKIWLSEHPVIRIGCPANYPPVMMWDGNKHTALAVEYNELLGQYTGANLEMLALSSQDTWTKALKKEVDGIFPSVNGIRTVRQEVRQSDSCMEAYVFAFTRTRAGITISAESDLKNKRVGYRKGVLHLKEMLEKDPSIIAVEYDNPSELLVALLEDKIEVIVGDMDIQSEAAGKTATIQIAHVFRDIPIKLCYSIRKDWPLLESIINKGIQAVPPEKLKALSALMV